MKMVKTGQGPSIGKTAKMGKEPGVWKMAKRMDVWRMVKPCQGPRIGNMSKTSQLKRVLKIVLVKAWLGGCPIGLSQSR